ncbi:hypothetical protein [Paraburkholderia youngii]|uniref:hypothetical protein n=1 Tax=Paraburkholderia youngii TaxID=2782701 RepID=UPI003D1F6906
MNTKQNPTALVSVSVLDAEELRLRRLVEEHDERCADLTAGRHAGKISPKQYEDDYRQTWNRRIELKRELEDVKARIAHAAATADVAQSTDLEAFPVLFELDKETGEATGTVMPFCSTACRDACGGTSYAGFPRSSEGTSRFSDFGYDPQCEQCGTDIRSALAHQTALA